MDNIQQEIIDLEREIRDLKTAQVLAGLSRMWRESHNIPTGTYSGTYTWTIHYEDVGDTNAPITYLYYTDAWSLRKYDSATNTQKVELYADPSEYWGGDAIFIVASSRKISSITQDF